jgi:hypothetical protein
MFKYLFYSWIVVIVLVVSFLSSKW